MNAPTIVSLEKAPDYDPGRILAAMRACLEPWGGMSAFVKSGQRVLLKPNLLGGFPPSRAVTTHPAVVDAAIRLVQEAGGRPMIGDNPAMGSLHGAVRASGLAPVIEATGCQLVEAQAACDYEVPGHRIIRRITLTKAMLEADVIISLPKLKTHVMMTMTGALKNQYGLIPGALKSQWHFRLQYPDYLASLILDINRIARPALGIMDAVVSMEGQGPSSGKPRSVGALLASPDLAALDTAACHLIGLDPMRVPLLAAARVQSYGETFIEKIHIAGEDWRKMRVPDFENVADQLDLLRLVPLPKPVRRWVRRQWTARPQIIDGRCTRCGICEKGCPVPTAAIHPETENLPKVDEARCIRCYCCHEFCPAQAITLEQSWVGRHVPLNAIADRLGGWLGFLLARKR